MVRILFVCTGNICRSPSAEAVFRHAINHAGLEHDITTDSAGTHGYHVGEAPDPRTVETAERQGYSMDGLHARQVTADDFYTFDVILALDNSHLRSLQKMRPQDATAELALFLPYSGVLRTEDVPDPYYGSQNDFDAVLELVEEGVAGLLDKLRTRMAAAA